ncbi:MAG: hypothetical protein JWO61_194 [Candidatus Saccharibacteria bacterium]|nr:hypothetical protein [Candidatus Saccharibacteria bacterium]
MSTRKYKVKKIVLSFTLTDVTSMALYGSNLVPRAPYPLYPAGTTTGPSLRGRLATAKFAVPPTQPEEKIMTTFDPNALLAAADEATANQLTELEKEVAVLGGQVMQLVRGVVESIHKDDTAPIEIQIQNAEQAKNALTRANALLRETPQERRSSERRPERQRQQASAPVDPTPPVEPTPVATPDPTPSVAPTDPPAPQVATPEPQPPVEPTKHTSVLDRFFPKKQSSN